MEGAPTRGNPAEIKVKVDEWVNGVEMKAKWKKHKKTGKKPPPPLSFPCSQFLWLLKGK